MNEWHAWIQNENSKQIHHSNYYVIFGWSRGPRLFASISSFASWLYFIANRKYISQCFFVSLFKTITIFDDIAHTLSNCSISAKRRNRFVADKKRFRKCPTEICNICHLWGSAALKITNDRRISHILLLPACLFRLRADYDCRKKLTVTAFYRLQTQSINKKTNLSQMRL